MKRAGVRQHHLDGLFVLALFGVFAGCVLAVLLTGAGSYRRLVARDAAAFSRRTAVQYIAAKVRQADAAAPDGRCGVFVGAFAAGEPSGGVSAGTGDTLFLEETVDGASYYTRIYYYDGYIRELYTAASAAAAPEDGEKVLDARALAFTLKDGLLSVTAAEESGGTAALSLELRSGEAGA